MGDGVGDGRMGESGVSEKIRQNLTKRGEGSLSEGESPQRELLGGCEQRARESEQFP